MLFSAVLLFAPLLAAALPEPEDATFREALEVRDAVQAREANEARDALAEVFGERSVAGGTPEDFGLQKRACDYNGCKCASGYVGVYCANCKTKSGSPYFVVDKLGTGGSVEHVYQCNGASSCCDYGYATKCKGGAAGRCGT